jgi:3-oxoacyl-[acyl-carrier-protein] synthase III
LIGAGICRRENTIVNVAERGNTATTTHLLALHDQILSGRVNPGDRVVFGISGSGQTVGTALYTLDDLPDRLRRKAAGRPARSARRRAPGLPNLRRTRVGIRVESLGIEPAGVSRGVDTLGLVRAAAEDCFGRSRYARTEIDLFLFTGVYRSEFLTEPAVAALAAGELGINGDVPSPDGPRTFAFDVVNGGLGFLNACHLAAGLIGAGKHRVAMVVASEVENNVPGGPAGSSGVLETGSAAILDASPNAGQGFGKFLFNSYPEHASKLSAYTGMAGGHLVMHVERDARLGEVYRECIVDAVQELLMAKGLSIDDVDVILPPQVAPGFVAELARALGADPGRCVDIAVEGKDYLSSSLVYAMRHALDQKMATSGDLGLAIVVGSGIQVGCALYRF